MKRAEVRQKPPMPQVIGKYTGDFVYVRVAPELLQELREHIASIVAVMQVSAD